MDDGGDADVICERTFERTVESVMSRVRARIFRPRELQEPAGDYRCPFEVVGLPEIIRASGSGVDSMQAIVTAFSGVHSSLYPYRKELTHLGMPYHEAALYIHIQDAGRRRRVEDIVDEELYAIEQRLLELKMIREEQRTLEAERRFRRRSAEND